MVLSDFFKYYRPANRSDMRDRWSSLLQVTVTDHNEVVKAAFAIVDFVEDDKVSMIVTYGDGTFGTAHCSITAIENGTEKEFYLAVK